jgi:hypothetical protein
MGRCIFRLLVGYFVPLHWLRSMMGVYEHFQASKLEIGFNIGQKIIDISLI